MDERTLLQKQLIYRSCHRGCKETDFLLGSFAMANLKNYSIAQLLDYKKIVEANDVDLYDWLNGKTPFPDHYNAEIMQSIIAYNSNNSNYTQMQSTQTRDNER